MKIRKYKNGTIRMTAENKTDSNNLTAFLAGCAGDNSAFAKLQKKERECPYCGSNNIIMFDSDNDICEDCRRYFPGS
jgi:ribosomal protein S27AE